MPMLLEVVEFWCQYFDRRKFEGEFSWWGRSLRSSQPVRIFSRLRVC